MLQGLRKLISAFSIFILLLGQLSLVPITVLAQEIDPSPTPPSATETPAPSESQAPETAVLTAIVYTDKSDYTATENVLIYGNNFSASQNYAVTVSSQDPPPVTYETGVTSDESGNFATNYQLDGNYRPNYLVEVKDSSNNIVATTTFTDNKTVTVSKNGTGSGTVTSSQPTSAVNCGSTCSASFGNNDQVTLNAVANLGSVIAGWTVPAGYTTNSGCGSSDSSCQFTMNNTAQTITVTFNAEDSTPPGITYNYPTAGDQTVWYNSNPGNVIDVDFIWGGGTPLDNAQRKIGSGSYANIFTVDQSSDYTTNWDITWGSLSEGLNEISLKVKDTAGNTREDVYSVGVSGFLFRKDTVNPTDPTSISSSSHTTSMWSSDDTVDVSWSGASDATSGVAGYSHLWDTNPSTTPDQVSEGTGTTSTSPSLVDGNSHYFHLSTVDNAGNWTSTLHLGPFFIDTTDPEIAFDSRTPANGNGWNNDDVTVIWTCSDATSGVVEENVSETVTTEGEDQETTGTCTDNAGNTASDTQDEINIDKTDPEVTITTPPDGAFYIATHEVIADWTATDDNIGTVVADAADGDPIDTATVGEKEFTVTATDLAGNETSLTNTYTVEEYSLGDGILPPIKIDGKTFKKTSTIPVKFKLTFSNGSPVADAIAHLFLDTPGTIPAVSSGGSNVGNLFRYDPTGQQYIFNLSTKGLIAGTTYHLEIVLDDGQKINQDIILK